MHSAALNTPIRATWRDYYQLCKPRVVMLMLLTAVVAMLQSASSWPGHALLYATVGIGLTAASGGVLNQLAEQHLDRVMTRTTRRPLPQQRILPLHAGIFALILGSLGLGLLFWQINALTALLTAASLLGYAGIYTLYLKRRTPQNIVIGGLAGAMPPLLGSSAITGTIDSYGICLVLIIFLWTPPHFWALAIDRIDDYKASGLPMMPVVRGIPYTKKQILYYTVAMMLATYLPAFLHHTGIIYVVGVSLLNAVFLYDVWQLYRAPDQTPWAMKTFFHSITYLMLLFLFLLIDHYAQSWLGF